MDGVMGMGRPALDSRAWLGARNISSSGLKSNGCWLALMQPATLNVTSNQTLTGKSFFAGTRHTGRQRVHGFLSAVGKVAAQRSKHFTPGLHAGQSRCSEEAAQPAQRWVSLTTPRPTGSWHIRMTVELVAFTCPAGTANFSNFSMTALMPPTTIPRAAAMAEVCVGNVLSRIPLAVEYLQRNGSTVRSRGW